MFELLVEVAQISCYLDTLRAPEVMNHTTRGGGGDNTELPWREMTKHGRPHSCRTGGACDMVSSSRLLVPSSPWVWCQAFLVHHHLYPRMSLDPADCVIDPRHHRVVVFLWWLEFTWLFFGPCRTVQTDFVPFLESRRDGRAIIAAFILSEFTSSCWRT
jgi:hypothetical protein